MQLRTEGGSSAYSRLTDKRASSHTLGLRVAVGIGQDADRETARKTL